MLPGLPHALRRERPGASQRTDDCGGLLRAARCSAQLAGSGRSSCSSMSALTRPPKSRTSVVARRPALYGRPWPCARLPPPTSRLLRPSQASRERHLPPLLDVVGCRHRVVGLEPEALAVLRRRQVVLDREVALEHLLRLAADQTDEVVGRIERRTGTAGSGFSSAGGSTSVPTLAIWLANGGDERGDIGWGGLVVRDVG